MIPEIDLGTSVSSGLNWVLAHWGGAFDLLAVVLERIVAWTLYFLQLPNPLVLIGVFVVIPLLFRRWGIAVFAGVAFVIIAGTGLWVEMLETLSLVLVAAAFAVIIGVPVGILAARSRLLSTALRPILDFMQTTPPFVYLIPAVLLFGIGIVPGALATVVFALPPAVRFTDLAIRQVDEEAVEAATALGAKPWQVLLYVQLPLGRPTLMAGINQVIMLGLSMVVVAGLAGGNGLGGIVTSAVTQLDVGAGAQGGLAVVLIAIYLDRVTSAFAQPRKRRRTDRSLKRPAPTEPEAATKTDAEAVHPDENLARPAARTV